MKGLAPLAFLAAALAAGAPSFAAEKSRVHALVSALGSEIQYVRQKRQLSNLPPYSRHTVAVPNVSIDAAVLRGLDRAVASEDPEAERVFLRISPEAIRDLYPYQRSEIVPARALEALKGMPEREKWDRIYLLTPRFLNPEREGMGPKLHGIGIYVQPLARNVAGSGISESEMDTSIDLETVAPDGEKSSSYRYVAPYFYAQLWIIDAKTMKVLEKKERYDFERIFDPKSTAIDVADQVPLEQLAAMMEKFVERAAARSVNEQIGEVIVKEPRVVNPAETK